MKLAFTVLITIASATAHAVNHCQETPQAISRFVLARDAGVTEEMALDLASRNGGYDQENLNYYKKMADLTYRFPFYDADRITGIAMRDCGK